MSQGAATEEIAAERLIMVAVEQVRSIDAGGDLFRQPVARVEVDDTVARNLRTLPASVSGV
jgi:hypothetical protein